MTESHNIDSTIISSESPDIVSSITTTVYPDFGSSNYNRDSPYIGSSNINIFFSTKSDVDHSDLTSINSHVSVDVAPPPPPNVSVGPLSI